MRMLTTIVPAPAGFTPVVLRKSVLLSGPLVILVADLAELAAVLDDFAQRLLGIVITPGGSFQLMQLSPLAWHAAIPADCMNAMTWLAPVWLSAIAAADSAGQRSMAADFRTERVTRELDMTRHDYNQLTSRLRAQVRDLQTAQSALSNLNEHLELRVEQRTADLAQALDELKRTQNELVRAAELARLGTLVAGVAHELNTPIGNALTIASSLAHETRQLKSQHQEGRLKRSALDAFLNTAEDATAVLERNLVRAAEIVGHFKQVAVDQVSENRRRFKLADVVADTLSALSPQLRKTPYSVTLELDASIDMDSYPGAIGQILSNFVVNALTHAFDGCRTGSMHIRSMASGDDKLVLSFIDNGTGIAADQIAHIFEPFYTTKFGQGGSGLGLYMVYNQVHKLLGGRLEVDSELGRGTCFHLVLPRVAPRCARVGAGADPALARA